MELTSQQLATIKADILANGDLNALPNTTDGNRAIADLYNAVASPTFVVWRTSISTKDCKTAMVWTEYIARSQGERDAWEFMLSNGTINGADSNIRQGILDIFSGPSGAATRANLTAIAKRNATRIEKLLATGTGSDASPGTMTVEGTISGIQVDTARNS